MSWPPARAWILGVIALVTLACLVAFNATSRADSSLPLSVQDEKTTMELGPPWVPEVVSTPGLPVQCADGAWTRTVVRGGCAKHGGVAH